MVASQATFNDLAIFMRRMECSIACEKFRYATYPQRHGDLRIMSV